MLRGSWGERLCAGRKADVDSTLLDRFQEHVRVSLAPGLELGRGLGPGKGDRRCVGLHLPDFGHGVVAGGDGVEQVAGGLRGEEAEDARVGEGVGDGAEGVRELAGGAVAEDEGVALAVGEQGLGGGGVGELADGGGGDARGEGAEGGLVAHALVAEPGGGGLAAPEDGGVLSSLEVKRAR